MSGQLTMIGDDWLSDRDRKAHARAEAARTKTGLECAKKLEAAADALNAYAAACNECRDQSAVRRADDSRVLLVRSLMEYSTWLDGKYGVKA
ncbi:hypothetical protein [Niveibacterium sp. SC-1]|uniref:hypothetical protein n=1 Tax=Niveibacterium sp. SC-1 TaxID=3135646 RepID=UPI00311F6CE4